MDKERLTPEELLAIASEEEAQQSRGKLKIYFGASPGVGKTHMMLEDARTKREEGLDVVVGIVESHGRKEIEQLIKGFEVLPRQQVYYNGRYIDEFDLDGALRRAPSLILIDEMAHTNAPNVRHPKRWQDIKEILDRGIDVYTTLNVQHLESLNDVVTMMIGIKVSETVPDMMFESADSIELVDLTPDKLLQRLHAGKIYLPEQAKIAQDNFFKKSNLFALRELALRTTAELVDTQVLKDRLERGARDTWAAQDRLLVCVGPEASAAHVLRSACQAANRMHADWFAVHVESSFKTPDEHTRDRVRANLKLAENLGAEVATIVGSDLVVEILKYAREKNVTKIIIGKNIRPRWKDFLFGSLVSELVRYSGGIDIYVVNGGPIGFKMPEDRISLVESVATFRDYLFAAIGVIGSTAINLTLCPYVGVGVLALVSLLGIIVSSYRGSYFPAMAACVIGVGLFSFLFLLDHPDGLIMSFMLLVISYIIARLTVITRRRLAIVQTREKRMKAMLNLSKQLATLRGQNNILDVATKYLADSFDSEVAAMMLKNNQLALIMGAPENQEFSDKDRAVAQWVFDMGQRAGLGTDTLPNSDAIYVPLQTPRGVLGVLRVKPRESDAVLTVERLRLLDAYASQIAQAIEADAD